MTSYREAFLADVTEHPDDDAARLVFADWLDDQGEAERAELIRLQVNRERLPIAEQIISLRESELLHQNRTQWKESLPRLEGVTWGEFSRGFVESAFAISVEAFERQAPAMFAAAPIQRLQIGELDDESTWRLMRSPHLLRLRELNLGNNPRMQPAVRAIAESPYVANLTSLLLHNNELGDRAAVLAQSSFLGRLQELFLPGNRLTDSILAPLARSSVFDNLVELDLRDNLIGDGGARALSATRMRGALKTLWLVNNRIHEAGAWALAGTPNLPSLARLYVNHNPIGNEGVIAIARHSPHLTLRELDLRSCEVGEAGARALIESQRMNSLEYLWLGSNRIRWQTVTDLYDRFGDRLRMWPQSGRRGTGSSGS